jgi:hypothetical protein
MADHWEELCSGCVPISIDFKDTLGQLAKIARSAPKTRGINRQLELCLVGLVSYFEAFCKELFAFSINIYPTLLERLRRDGPDISIDPLMAVEMGDKLKDKIGFIITERLNFGTPKEINANFRRLLTITPFGEDEAKKFEELLRDRNLLVHYGGTYTFRYIDQLRASPAGQRAEDKEAHWNSFVLDSDLYFNLHEFVAAMSRKMLLATHKALATYGMEKHGIEKNAPVDSLLWEPPDRDDD